MHRTIPPFRRASTWWSTTTRRSQLRKLKCFFWPRPTDVERGIPWTIAGMATPTGRYGVRAWPAPPLGLAGAKTGSKRQVYVVTSNRDDNPVNPAPGTLRYAVTRPEVLQIIFAGSMTIKLKNELLNTSFKTTYSCGLTVHIVEGGGLTVQRVSNVIVHGLVMHDIISTGPGRIMTSTKHVSNRGRCDGDAISIFASKDIWIDHCYFSNAADGLVDVIRGSTSATITNDCY
ncbi:hypothetical protein M758_1G009400 [Ceratodon purpureus]|nr:hypothetical protein M758_1G009400 [Ceratodon purpureus]